MPLNTLLAGILLGISFCAPIGPVTLETMRRGLRGGFRSALFVQLGSLIGDTTFCVLAFLGLAPLVTHDVIRIPLWVAGAVALVYLGYTALRDAWRMRSFAMPLVVGGIEGLALPAPLRTDPSPTPPPPGGGASAPPPGRGGASTPPSLLGKGAGGLGLHPLADGRQVHGETPFPPPEGGRGLGQGTADSRDNLGRDFRTGAIMSLTNPMAILWWVSIGGAMLAAGVTDMSVTSIVAFIVSFFLGCLLYAFFMAGLVGYGRRVMNPTLFRATTVLSGLALLAFGGQIGWQALTTLVGKMS